MATTADFRNGLCLDYNNDLYTIVQFQHVKPGKGPAFVRTKLKSLTTGKVIENTFSAGVKVNTARVERRPYQYLYTDDLGLKEGQSVEIVVHADTETPLTVDLPPFVELAITYTEPGEKGNTASSSVQKPAELETGAKIMVPLFINTDEMIKVDTRDRSYSERVKK